MYYLGVDIGCESVNVALVETESGEKVISSKDLSNDKGDILGQNVWVDQNPEHLWNTFCTTTKRVIQESKIRPSSILGIGISYQLYGLFAVDINKEILKKVIDWRDNKAIKIDHITFNDSIDNNCVKQLLKFSKDATASKRKRFKEKESDIYSKINKFMLPGDFIVFKLTNRISTTRDGLSELGIWNTKTDELDDEVLDFYQIKKRLIPTIVENVESQGQVTELAFKETGIPSGTPILFRSEKKACIALSISASDYGDVTITGQSPLTIYAKPNQLKAKEPLKTKNIFNQKILIGKSLIFKGGYIQYEWVKKQFKESSFEIMNQKASEIPIGSEGVTIFPFGNGAEQMLKNINLGGIINNLNLNCHSKGNLFRATIEGIAFSIIYGLKTLKGDFEFSTIKVENGTLFQSEIFVNTLTSVLGEKIDIFNVDLAVGAAISCSLLNGDYKIFDKIISKNVSSQTYEILKNREPYIKAYLNWEKELEIILRN